MRFHKPLKMPLLTRVLDVGGRRVFHVAALFAFPLGNPRALLDEVAFWAAVTPLLARQGGVLDEGFCRAKAEFLVLGSFHAPGGAPLSASYVRARVGALEKRLAVIGDRHWQRGVPTQPLAMTTMPIDWAHALGGPAHGANPQGIGIELVERGGQKVQPLPNVEHYGALIRSPGDRPEPAGFGPMDVSFEPRRKRAGTYGKEYVADRRVGLADDHDPTLWNMAPTDQWQDSPFTGREEYALENLHPKSSLLTGRLPGLVPRIFLVRHPGGEACWAELPMRCDVVWLFPEPELGVVLFHGSAPVREPDAADVTELLAGADVLGAERPEEHFRAAWRRRSDPDRANVALLSDSDLMPPRESGVAANVALPDIGQWTKSEGLLAKKMHKGALRNRELAIERIVSQGLDPAAHGLGGPPPAPPVFPDTEDLDAIAEEMERVADREAAARKDAEQKTREGEARAREAYTSQGIDYDAKSQAFKEAEVGGPPRFSADLVLREQKKLAAEAGPESALAAQVNDPAYRALLEQQERKIKDGYRVAAHQQPAAVAMSAEAAQLARVIATTAKGVGEPLSERDFTGADFSGLDLRGVDFSRSFLECADLRDADLSDAILEGAVMSRADLRGANLTRARLRGANLGMAILCETNLDSADLREAVLMRTDLQKASFRGAELEGADVMEVVWRDADLTGARLSKVTFLKGQLLRCCFSGVDLEQAMFLECTLDESDFGGANLRRASFIKSRGQGVRFAGARIDEAVFVGEGAFPDADFRDVRLERSCLRKTNLRGSRFDRADATMADFSECDATGARFDRASMKGALLQRTDLTGASLRGCNLLEGLLMGARLPGADFTGAQLARAVFTGARGDGATRFTDAQVAHAQFDRRPESAEGA